MFRTGLRVEWAKTKARAARWSEEVLLLAEEMRRTLWFLNWKATWWIEQDSREDMGPDFQEGFAAYSSRQSALLCEMEKQFADKWYSILVENGLCVEWPEKCMVGRHAIPVHSITLDEISDDEPLALDDDLFE